MNDHSHDVGIDKAGFIHDGGADSSSPVLRVEGGQGFSPIQVGGEGRYSLLLKGGRVIDPAQEISEERDVAISGSKIARVAKNIAESEAKQVLDVRGKIVTPGLIDVHVHVYDGVVPFGIPADPNCIAKGVTTVVDAGSAGAHTFRVFGDSSSVSPAHVFTPCSIFR